MADFPEREPPRFWIAMSLLVAGLALAVFMSVVLTIKAHAQEQPLCAPMSQLAPAWEERLNERIIWEGVVPTEQGPIEFVLFQSEKGGWSLFVVQNGIACLRAAGKDGTDVGRGV